MSVTFLTNEDKTKLETRIATTESDIDNIRKTGINKFDKNSTDILQGYYKGTTFVEHESYLVTHIIKVDGGSTYKWAYYTSIGSSSPFVFCDNNGEVTSSGTVELVDGWVVHTFDEDALIRICFNPNKIDTFMVCKQHEYPDSYVDYHCVMADGTLLGDAQIDQILGITNKQGQDKTPLLTLMDDDGRIEVLDKLKPLSDTYGIPFVVAMITERLVAENTLYMNPEHLVMLQDARWEISSHTHTHPNLSTLDEAAQEEELRQSKEILESYGLKVNTITYPYGGKTANTYKIARKYYRAGRDTMAVDYMNETPLETWSMRVTPFNEPGTLEEYKAKIDQAVENNSWLIFLTHVGDSAHSTEQQTYLEEVIQYAISLNIPIVTLTEGIERRGNIVDIGSYDREDLTTDHFVVGCDGTWSASHQSTIFLPDDSVTIDSAAAYFPVGLMSKVYLSNGLNGQSGHLVTDKRWKRSTGFAIQYWHPFEGSSNLAYRTTKAGSGIWASWKYLSNMAMATEEYLNNATFVSSPGTSIFDTTLRKPVWFDGITWVDATGAYIDSNFTPTELKIITQPSSITVAASSSVQFTVAAQGDGLSYQWQYSKDSGASWVTYSGTGATTATMTVVAYSSRNGYMYRCVVTDGYGESVTSNAATLTVESATA